MYAEDMDSASVTIADMLIDAGMANEEQIVEMWDEHQRTGTAFKTVIYNFEIMTEEQLMRLIAENLGSQYLDLAQYDLNIEVIRDYEGETMRLYQIMPVQEQDGVLFVAALDPLNFRLVDELPQVLGKPVEILVSKEDDILQAIDTYYPEATLESMSSVLEELDKSAEFSFGEEDDEDDEEDEANKPAIVRFVDAVLFLAVKDQASDIHFEPFANQFRIRYRIDGVLYEMNSPNKKMSAAVISRVKVVSGLNIAEKKKPQDGRIEMRIGGRRIDLRVSCLPTQYGESVVLRVLDKGAVSLNLDVLGMPEWMSQEVRDMIAKPNGIFLVTGPTGSGKTTTLYSCLHEINKPGDKVLTCEDPVEFNIEGLIQVPVQEAMGMTFFKALKAFLRQDPDKIMVGEIRDGETAGIAIEASLTGHFVLSTLHTNDAPSAVTRLCDMGVEPFLVTSTVEGVLAQRLVRRVCKHCRESYQITEGELSKLRMTQEDVGSGTIYRGVGCDECNHTGYKGRVGLYEIFKFSPVTRQLAMDNRPALEIFNQAVKEGMRPLRQHGIETILSGVSTVEEILKYT
ncbi:MAG: Flp pilus assembly complex ATPase component TadA [Lentisphaeria bacterium]|nr:Flp pilus assembly complex ATPase component TadA [Lentisphaeria bacterium]